MSFSIAIIPARGGSKRLPGKNIKLLAGKPLITWTINSAKDYGKFDLVLVSTDSSEIAEIAKEAGAIVPFLRPSHLSNDGASTNDVVNHMVAWVEGNYQKVTLVTLLQPTSPLRDEKDISLAMALYEEKGANAVISVCEVEHPLEFCNKLQSDLSLEGFIRIENQRRTQEFDKSYRLNGAIYIFNRNLVGAFSNFYSKGSFAYVMDKNKSIDIDDEYDFMFADVLKKRMLLNSNEN
ncbi:acylneuraminate cytidylyltransferase family protein [uncultured Pantoea sp.]|uniref:acylneuraminate cytidylyltransferase family protein n=1 Tax=uncultured Pantoea sp. TaxID=218084 RepID=UPI0025E1D03F|nr:acylneuraminate cytidylyltransferase family protein [uncultured Pantoea sp.]